MLLGRELLRSVLPSLPSFSEAKNYSAANSGMFLPLLRTRPACRQARSKIPVPTKEHPTCVRPPVTIRRKRWKWGVLDRYPPQ
jgi:hypothetical protein